MVASAGSPICFVHADVTFTLSKVKVNVRAITAARFQDLLFLQFQLQLIDVTLPDESIVAAEEPFA